MNMPLEIDDMDINTLKVLVVDDDQATRLLLRAAISQWGYQVLEASDGQQAWEIITGHEPPHLIVLDWMMPKLDGIGLCQKIKNEKFSIYPYIILLTNITGTSNVIKGLDAGAHDFLEKPFNMAELRSRLAAGARIIKYEETLAKQNKQLQHYTTDMETIAQERAEQIVYSEQLSILGSIASSIISEINKSLSLVMKSEDELNNARVSFAAKMPYIVSTYEQDDRISTAFNQLTEKQSDFHRHVIQLDKIIKTIQIFMRKETMELVPCNLNDCVNNVLEKHGKLFEKHIHIKKNLDEKIPLIYGQPNQLKRVISKLIMNAVKSMSTVQGKKILTITTHLTNKKIQLIVEDTGHGFSKEKLKTLFQPIFIDTDAGRGSGLGLIVIKNTLEEISGSIIAENRKEGGARFIVEFPVIDYKEMHT